MRQFLILCICLSIGGFVNAQKQTIKLEYMVVPNGSIMHMSIAIAEMRYDSAAGLWQLSDRSKRISSISSGKQYYWYPRFTEESVIVPDDRSYLSLMPAEYEGLKENGTINFQGQLLQVITTDYPKTYNTETKKFKAIVAENNTGSVRIWVLDNPFLPIILKTEGSPYNADIELIEVR